jgi:RNase adapter protein RapZ
VQTSLDVLRREKLVKLLIISGRSGSGKSTVLHILEDRGYYCIDNLPASLLPALAKRVAVERGLNPNVAVSIDARNIYADLQKFPEIFAGLTDENLHPDIIFLDANNQILLRRFSESRRKHPLSNEKIGLKEAIDKETDLLKPIAALASLTVDTSTMSLHGLRDLIKTRIIDQSQTGMSLQFQSFGYKNGVPVDADIVYDVRCLPNPYWETGLRTLTGLDEKVSSYLENQQLVQDMYSDILLYLQTWLPRFEDNNRSYITVALGCTGGQHRSVYLCEKLAKYFSSSNINVQVRHRELPQQGELDHG